MISAEIVADSKNEFGNRITTFVLTFPRIVLAEFNTHRMISKNSASSRAIPFETMLKRIEENPFIPIKWMKEHKGMQGFDYFDEHYSAMLTKNWIDLSKSRIVEAEALSNRGVSKQIVNRLLEPFMWHTVIATATEWENFFALRAHPMAEIHIQDLAYKMLEVYNNSTPKELKAGEWHIPFEDKINEEKIKDFVGYILDGSETDDEEFLKQVDIYKVKISTAISAGISYGRIKDVTDFADLIDLHDSLVIRPYNGKRGIRDINDPIHASPSEHCGQAMNKEEIWTRYGTTAENAIGNGWCGNFKGFKQYRKMLENENSKDPRVIKK